MNSTENIYNVDKYSDEELYNILDLVNPSDRELEAKINNMIWKYTNIGGDSGDRLTEFFTKIYERFFVTENDEEEQEEQKQPEKEEKQSESELEMTLPLDYAKGTLNPLLQQTTKRIISIDSQYRDNKSSLSSDFTFNLSDPLRDVLNLKLYSIQIPYTWYTINNNYGSNFFFLKGNSSGIDNGNHDIKIEIPIGNYTAEELIAAVNLSLTTIKTDASYSDASFNNTEITYDYAKSKATLNFDISKHYNENQYEIEFLNPNNFIPSDTENKAKSIPSFLGFNYNKYYGYMIKSKLEVLPLQTQTVVDNDTNVSNFSLTTNNNYFDIVNYVNSSVNDEYNANTSTIINSFRIHLSLQTGTTYSRQELVNDLNTQLQNNSNLLNISQLKRINVTNSSTNILGNVFLTTDPLNNLVGQGFSHYEMHIRINRFKINQIQNSKITVIFPEDTDIWTGPSSAFVFDTSINEVSNIVSETKTEENTFDVILNPKILLECKKTFFDNSLNNFEFPLPNGSYLLNDLIAAINTNIINTNEASKDHDNTSGVFKILNTFAEVDNNDNFFELKIDLTKRFTEKSYFLDLENSVVNDKLTNINALTQNSVQIADVANIDLSNNNVLVSTFSIGGSGLELKKDDKIFKIFPNSTLGNKNYPEITILALDVTWDTDLGGNSLDKKTYFLNTAPQLELDINRQINNYDDGTGNNPLAGTNISLVQDGNNLIATLTIVKRINLTQSDFDLTFLNDELVGTTPTTFDIDTDASNVWAFDLNIGQSTFSLGDASYNTANVSFSQVRGISKIVSKECIITTSVNDQIFIRPVSDAGGEGIFTDTNANSLTFTIPQGNYTRDQLINVINTQFSSVVTTGGFNLSNNTLITVLPNNNIKLRLNINKTYRAEDYRVVFYDPLSFVTYAIGPNIVTNTTWDATLGWILGFRISTEYYLTDFTSSTSDVNVRSITGDNVVSISIYNYFMIILDDYNQNHLNDGVVTTAQKETTTSLPSYSVRSATRANPSSGEPLTSTIKKNGQNMTKNEIYAAQEILSSNATSGDAIISSNNSLSARTVQYYSSGPFAKNVFALVPLKISGLKNNQIFVEFGGTLQNQQRTYFGPVNINRMTVKLMNDKGELVDLNGANWSFSFVCEQLYQQKKT